MAPLNNGDTQDIETPLTRTISYKLLWTVNNIQQKIIKLSLTMNKQTNNKYNENRGPSENKQRENRDSPSRHQIIKTEAH